MPIDRDGALDFTHAQGFFPEGHDTRSGVMQSKPISENKGQTMQQTMTRAMAPVAVVMVTLCSCTSGAWAESNPLSLSVSERLSYDNNFLRRANGGPSETTSSTGANVAYAKSHGRQNYSASLSVSTDKHQDFKDYDFNGFSGSVGVSSTVGARGYVSLLHSASRSQQTPDSQTGARINDAIKSNSTSLFTQYGVNGRVGVNAQLLKSKTTYSVNTLNGRDSVALRLGASFSPSDLVSFGSGVRKSDQTVAVNDDKITRYDYDVNTYWAVTGYSTLSAALSLTREQHSLNTSTGFKGTTGSLAWAFTPGGKMSYSLALDRDNGNSVAGAQYRVTEGQTTTRVDSTQANTQLTTSLSGAMNWAATSKLQAGLRLTYMKFDDASSSTVSSVFGSGSSLTPSDGRQLNVGVSLGYVPARWLNLGCSLDAYDRKGSRLSVAGYKGEALSCNARLSMN
jgi:hypothetical protein